MKQIVIASVEKDGVRYDLVVNRIDPVVFDGPGETMQQEPKVIATKVI